MKTCILRLLFSLAFLMSCNPQELGENDGSKDSTSEPLKSYSLNGNNFKVSLTDAPNKELAKVNVTIKEVLLKVGGSSTKRAEVKIAEGIGQVDLLTLQNGVLLPMADIKMPIGIKVNQIRLVLEDFGNNIVYKDGSVCDLQTPSQQKSGLKLINPEFQVKEGRSYSLVVDFDAKKSIVHKGNGGCLLKPVLRWGGISSVPEEEVDQEDPDDEEIIDEGNDGSGEESGQDNSEDESDEEDDSGDESVEPIDCYSLDFDLYDSTTWPEGFVFDDYAHCY